MVLRAQCGISCSNLSQVAAGSGEGLCYNPRVPKPRPQPGDVQAILAQLERNDGRFPREAVCAAISCRDEIIPEFLRILERTVDNLEELAGDTDYFAPIYAMFLLAQFRENRAYPVLVRLFSVPGEAVMDLAGHVVTESLGRILASVSLGDMRGMAALVENRQANEYVRSAALRGMVTLVAAGEKTREEVMDYFASLFHGRLAREPDYVWYALARRSVDLYPGEVYREITQAFEEGLIEPFMFCQQDVEDAYALGREEALSRLPGNPDYRLITDTVTEMEWWACFPQNRTKLRNTREPRLDFPTRATKPKVGRNDPCPCGSGKKYKKCCSS